MITLEVLPDRGVIAGRWRLGATRIWRRKEAWWVRQETSMGRGRLVLSPGLALSLSGVTSIWENSVQEALSHCGSDGGLTATMRCHPVRCGDGRAGLQNKRPQ